MTAAADFRARNVSSNNRSQRRIIPEEPHPFLLKKEKEKKQEKRYQSLPTAFENITETEEEVIYFFTP